jgi:hypothetical protein
MPRIAKAKRHERRGHRAVGGADIRPGAAGCDLRLGAGEVVVMGWPKGRTRSPETRAKIAAANRNRSPESRAKMAEARRGKTHSSETRAKIAEARNPLVAGFTEAQRADFKVFRSKGYSSDEARELVLSDV